MEQIHWYDDLESATPRLKLLLELERVECFEVFSARVLRTPVSPA